MFFNTYSPVLAAVFLLSFTRASSLFPNAYGLAGPENVMLFLNGFHFISGSPEHYLSANHHCVIVTADPVFLQCLIYVPGTNPVRLAGIEYIIGKEAFEKLDYEERQLWHSHSYEVASGLLVEPGTPPGVDNEAMKILVNTYGKTTHTWRYDQKNNTLPLGIPEFVGGFTNTGQLSEAAIEARDEYFGLNSTALHVQREQAGIDPVEVVDGADIWKKGIILTLGLVNKTGRLDVRILEDVAGVDDPSPEWYLFCITGLLYEVGIFGLDFERANC